MRMCDGTNEKTIVCKVSGWSQTKHTSDQYKFGFWDMISEIHLQRDKTGIPKMAFSSKVIKVPSNTRFHVYLHSNLCRTCARRFGAFTCTNAITCWKAFGIGWGTDLNLNRLDEKQRNQKFGQKYAWWELSGIHAHSASYFRQFAIPIDSQFAWIRFGCESVESQTYTQTGLILLPRLQKWEVITKWVNCRVYM